MYHEPRKEVIELDFYHELKFPMSGEPMYRWRTQAAIDAIPEQNRELILGAEGLPRIKVRLYFGYSKSTPFYIQVKLAEQYQRGKDRDRLAYLVMMSVLKPAERFATAAPDKREHLPPPSEHGSRTAPGRVPPDKSGDEALNIVVSVYPREEKLAQTIHYINFVYEILYKLIPDFAGTGYYLTVPDEPLKVIKFLSGKLNQLLDELKRLDQKALQSTDLLLTQETLRMLNTKLLGERVETRFEKFLRREQPLLVGQARPLPNLPYDSPRAEDAPREEAPYDSPRAEDAGFYQKSRRAATAAAGFHHYSTPWRLPQDGGAAAAGSGGVGQYSYPSRAPTLAPEDIYGSSPLPTAAAAARGAAGSPPLRQPEGVYGDAWLLQQGRAAARGAAGSIPLRQPEGVYGDAWLRQSEVVYCYAFSLQCAVSEEQSAGFQDPTYTRSMLPPPQEEEGEVNIIMQQLEPDYAFLTPLNTPVVRPPQSEYEPEEQFRTPELTYAAVKAGLITDDQLYPLKRLKAWYTLQKQKCDDDSKFQLKNKAVALSALIIYIGKYGHFAGKTYQQLTGSWVCKEGTEKFVKGKLTEYAKLTTGKNAGKLPKEKNDIVMFLLPWLDELRQDIEKLSRWQPLQ